MVKYADYIYDKYDLNLTNYTTSPSLSFANYGLNYYNEDLGVKKVKGPIEKAIRESYYGGNVDVFVNNDNRILFGNYYHYDMNSQYPNAMLNKMPTGDPVFSTNPNLDDYFGFVYAIITPPSSEKLPNLFIQYRNANGMITCPRNKFSRWIFSEELKQAISYGYTATILAGINFPDHTPTSEALFGNYIKTLYKIKEESTGLAREDAKLKLNSLYGKFGQKDIEFRIRVVSKTEAEKIVKNYHYTIFTELNDQKVLVKYSSRINEKLRKLLAFDYNNINEEKGYSRTAN